MRSPRGLRIAPGGITLLDVTGNRVTGDEQGLELVEGELFRWILSSIFLDSFFSWPYALVILTSFDVFAGLEFECSFAILCLLLLWKSSIAFHAMLYDFFSARRGDSLIVFVSVFSAFRLKTVIASEEDTVFIE